MTIAHYSSGRCRVLVLAALCVALAATGVAAQHSLFQLSAKSLAGKEVKLDRFKGHVMLIVNVASQCGFTDRDYPQLQALQDKYGDRGLVVMLFPCNQFGKQEPGRPVDIVRFMKSKGVRLVAMEKVDVNGPNSHPVFKFLKLSGPTAYPEVFDVGWNFEKFLVNRSGECEKRYGSKVEPMAMQAYIERLLDEPNPYEAELAAEAKAAAAAAAAAAAKTAGEASAAADLDEHDHDHHSHEGGDCHADLPPGA